MSTIHAAARIVQAAARAAILTTFKQQIARLEDAQQFLKNTLLGAGYIVECERLPLKFAFHTAAGERQAILPGICNALEATRFTLEDARGIAANVRNGNGSSATAIHLRDVVERDLAEMRVTVAVLELLSDDTTTH